MLFNVVSVSTYRVEAENFEEAIDKAMNDDFIYKDEDFPNPEGFEE